MARKFLSLLLASIVLIGCAAAPSATPTNVATNTAPAPTNTVAPTKTSVATSTPLPPTSTSSPTATPYAPLSAQGPYLVYPKTINKQTYLVMLDANGKGRKEIQVPAYTQVRSISPNGKWIAFYTGSADGREDYRSKVLVPPFDLTLNLLNVETGETKILAKLLSKDYPDNFQTAADELKKRAPTNTYSFNAEQMQDAFLYGIRSLDWSPDSRYLAFAGQMDGLSSDLYVYDMQQQTIKRISDGAEQILYIKWSPNGKWILHGSANFVGMGSYTKNHVATTDGSIVRSLSGNNSGANAIWVSDSMFADEDGSNGRGLYGLRVIDADKGTVIDVSSGTFRGYAIDPIHKLAIVSKVIFNPQVDNEKGLYLMDLTSRESIRLAVASGNDFPNNWECKFVTGRPYQFVARNLFTRETIGITIKGEIIKITDRFFNGIISPDANWLVLRENSNEWNLYTSDEKFSKTIATISKENINSNHLYMMWRPDSKGVFYIEETNLYYIDISNYKTILVDEYKTDSKNFDWGNYFRWISGK